MKIDAAKLKLLQEQVRMRNQAAGALGVALAEYEMEKMRLDFDRQKMTPDERHLRLGALQSEFDGYRDTHMKIVVRTSAVQAAIGESALADLGLASKERTFTIDTANGDVLELLNGSYVPVKEAA